jgi:hypothetical protein
MILLTKLRQSLHWRRKPREAFLLSSIDPDEFSDLLRSGRKQDLESLAKKLSEHPRAPRPPASVMSSRDMTSPGGGGTAK